MTWFVTLDDVEAIVRMKVAGELSAIEARQMLDAVSYEVDEPEELR